MSRYLAPIVLAAVSFACHAKGEPAPVPKPAVEEPPCHVPVKIRKEPTRVVLIDCDGNETAITNAEITGPSGKPGNDGHDGSAGRPGPEGPVRPEGKIAWCRHDPVTHRNHTLYATPTEIISKYGGYYGSLDFSGECGDWENKCSCDAPICRNDNPAVHHYMTDGAD